MDKRWEVTWEGELPAAPRAVWETITRHAGSYLWPIEYEPRVGGAERGLTRSGGTVTVWEPHRHFATRAPGNELEYALEPLGAITYLRVTHRAEIPEAEYDLQLAMCRAHTAFYQHSLGVAACHFPGRTAAYEADEEVEGTFAEVCARHGVHPGAMVGDRVEQGVIDYLTPSFLGIRGTGHLFRVYGRDTWGYPVGTTTHRFGAEA